MVSMFSSLLHAIDTMKNTIDDADCIIDWIVLIIAIQCVRNSCHSHSIINEQSEASSGKGFTVAMAVNTMKHTLPRLSSILKCSMFDHTPRIDFQFRQGNRIFGKLDRHRQLQKALCMDHRIIAVQGALNRSTGRENNQTSLSSQAAGLHRMNGARLGGFFGRGIVQPSATGTPNQCSFSVCLNVLPDIL